MGIRFYKIILMVKILKSKLILKIKLHNHGASIGNGSRIAAMIVITVVMIVMVKLVAVVMIIIVMVMASLNN